MRRERDDDGSSRTDWPVRSNQEARLLFEDLAKHFRLNSPPLNIVLALRLTGTLDRRLLKGAIDALVQHHPQLTAEFRRSEDVSTVELRRRLSDFAKTGRFEPGLYRQAAVATPGVELDERTINVHGNLEEGISRAIEPDVMTAFSGPPRIRAILFRLKSDDHVLVLVVCHLVADGQSLSVLARHLTALYAGRNGELLRPGRPDYRQCVLSELECLASNQYDQSLEYWSRQWSLFAHCYDRRLARYGSGADQPLQLFEVESLLLSADATSRLRALGESRHFTLQVVFRACLSIALAQHTGESCVTTWCNFANRSLNTREVVGLLNNRHIIVVEYQPHDSGLDVLERTKTVVLDALAHQGVQLVWLWRRLGRNLDFDCVRAQIVMDFSSRERDWTGNGVRARRLHLFAGRWARNADLDVRVEDKHTRIAVFVRYSPRRFSRPDARSLLKGLERCLQFIAMRPGQPLST